MMQQRNIFQQPIEYEWGIIFCRPKSNSGRSETCLEKLYLPMLKLFRSKVAESSGFRLSVKRSNDAFHLTILLITLCML